MAIGQLGHHQKQVIGIAPAGGDQPICPVVGNLAVPQVCQTAGSTCNDAFDKREPKHLGDRPQLRSSARISRLVGLHERDNGLAIEAQAGVGDDLARQSVYARESLMAFVIQHRKLPVETERQILLHVPHAAVDDVPIVKNPLDQWRRPLLDLYRR